MTTPANSSPAPYVLEVHDAVKRFGGVSALGGVDLNLRRREVLALLGDNGAGKSTMVKAISGAHRLDGGEILIEGEPVAFKAPDDARRAGIETVYQDLALFDNLAAAANLFAGRERTTPRWLGRLGFLQDRTMTEETAELLSRLRISVGDLSSPVGLISGGQRQAVAVARAAAFAKRIVILDEPTAALGVRESKAVLDLITRLPAEGLSVILISHNLEHVAQVADRAIVLRRGQCVGEATPTPENHERLVSMIVGASEWEPNGRLSADTSPNRP